MRYPRCADMVSGRLPAMRAAPPASARDAQPVATGERSARVGMSPADSHALPPLRRHGQWPAPSNARGATRERPRRSTGGDRRAIGARRNVARGFHALPPLRRHGQWPAPSNARGATRERPRRSTGGDRRAIGARRNVARAFPFATPAAPRWSVAGSQQCAAARHPRVPATLNRWRPASDRRAHRMSPADSHSLPRLRRHGQWPAPSNARRHATRECPRRSTGGDRRAIGARTECRLPIPIRYPRCAEMVSGRLPAMRGGTPPASARDAQLLATGERSARVGMSPVGSHSLPPLRRHGQWPAPSNARRHATRECPRRSTGGDRRAIGARTECRLPIPIRYPGCADMVSGRLPAMRGGTPPASARDAQLLATGERSARVGMSPVGSHSLPPLRRHGQWPAPSNARRHATCECPRRSTGGDRRAIGARRNVARGFPFATPAAPRWSVAGSQQCAAARHPRVPATLNRWRPASDRRA